MADQSNTRTASWSTVLWLVPWITAAIVIWITINVDRSLGLAALGFDQRIQVLELTDLAGASRRLLAGLGWGVSALGFSLVALAAVIASFLVAVICLSDLGGRRGVVYGIAILTIAVALVGIIGTLGIDIMTEPGLTDQLRGLTLRQMPEKLAVSMDKLFDRVTYVSFALLLCAASATLTWREDVAPPATLKLKRRLEGLQWLLYVGTAALVLRVLENYMFYRWPAVWLSPDMGKAVDRTALAVSTAYGAFYTAILLGLYVPTALVMRLRATWLANRATAGTPENPEAWIARMQLAASPFQQLSHLFLTLAPLLAGGPLAKLIDIYVS